MSKFHTLSPMADLPYFDLLLEGRPRSEAASSVFSRFVHWGYWEDPSKATLDPAAFAAAMERLNAEVLAAAKLEGGRKVLDAGCGFGGTLAGLRAAFPASVLCGVNIDRRQLQAAADPKAAFRVEADACALPFLDASFDRVLAVECIFHFPSRLAFIKEASRVLKEDGLLALSDFVPAPGRTSWILDRLSRVVEKFIAWGYGTIGSGWPDGTYAEMARAAGLEVETDRDITAATLPTYPIVLDLMRKAWRGRRPGDGGKPILGRGLRLFLATVILQWLSRARLVRYRIVAFRKTA
jgi:SAM-dependent methyltransferase